MWDFSADLSRLILGKFCFQTLWTFDSEAVFKVALNGKYNCFLEILNIIIQYSYYPIISWAYYEHTHLVIDILSFQNPVIGFELFCITDRNSIIWVIIVCYTMGIHSVPSYRFWIILYNRQKQYYLVNHCML